MGFEIAMAVSLPFKQIQEYVLVEGIQDSPYSMAVRGYQPGLKRWVFIKLLKPQVKNHREWVNRFRREAQVCARLKHPHIVDVYTVGEADEYTFMALEYVSGLSLKELLEKERIIPLPLALEIIRQLLLALEFAHQNGVIHRDIKPGNIMLDVSGQVRLTDFGLAFLGEEATLTRQGSILGTPAYMAPEQATGETVTPASDFFSLGATLYEMLTGVKPFAGENYSACLHKILNETPPAPSALNKDVPAEVDSFVFQLIEKDPARRPASAREIRLQIDSFLKNENEENLKSDLSALVRKYFTDHTVEDELPPETPDRREKKKTVGRKTGISFRILIAAAGFVLVLIALWLWFLPGNESAGFHQTEGEPGIAEKAGVPAASEPQTLTDSVREKENSAGGKEQPETGKIAGSSQIFEEPPAPSLNSEKRTAPRRVSVQKEKGEPIPSSEENTPVTSGEPEAPATLLLNVEPWASVSIDGRKEDTLVRREKISLPPGKHRLVLSHPEFPPKIWEINLNAGEKREIIYSFLKNAAFLWVEVRPWAEVYLDGERIDTTPMNRPMVLIPGEHVLELKHPDFPTYRQVIHVRAGDTLQVRKNLLQ